MIYMWYDLSSRVERSLQVRYRSGTKSPSLRLALITEKRVERETCSLQKDGERVRGKNACIAWGVRSFSLQRCTCVIEKRMTFTKQNFKRISCNEKCLIFRTSYLSDKHHIWLSFF